MSALLAAVLGTIGFSGFELVAVGSIFLRSGHGDFTSYRSTVLP